jgi:hypothetical protein
LDDLFPTLDECNDLIDWIEENNDIDSNVVKFRIRESEVAQHVVTVTWVGRDHDDPPRAHELILQRGWVIEKWEHHRGTWTSVIWRVPS